MSETAKRIIEAREQAGLSREQLCRNLGIPYRTLQNWETGARNLPEYTLNMLLFCINHYVRFK